MAIGITPLMAYSTSVNGDGDTRAVNSDGGTIARYTREMIEPTSHQPNQFDHGMP